MTDIRFPYEDPQIPVEARVEDLLARMTIEDKVGLLFADRGYVSDPEVGMYGGRGYRPADLIRQQRINHWLINGSVASGREFATWMNAYQRIALEHPLRIPATLQSDPRHGTSINPQTADAAAALSSWPDPIGLAALRDPERVFDFADIMRQEYRAVGLTVSLHPQIDLATEPRWARASATFGEDADLTCDYARAYIRGLQGTEFGAQSVSAMAKHFPGGGAQKDGLDPHFADGREQVYPGGMRDYHLKPFIAAIEAGVRLMMPYYGMPVGTDWEEIGFAFSKGIMTDLLRTQLGFEGITCTDYSVVTDDPMLPVARCWGAEHLTRHERLLRLMDAGNDQIGGEHCTDVMLDLVRSGQLTEARIDVSARKLLREKFLLGLFEQPFVDEERAQVIAGCDAFRARGLAAQRDAVTLVQNNDEFLPLASGKRIYAEGFSPNAFGAYGTLVATPEEADVAIVRLKAPFTPAGGMMRAFFHEGPLDFSEETIAHVREIAAAVPTVMDVYCDRAAILTPLGEVAAAMLVNFSCEDAQLLAVIFGEHAPTGRLPMEFARSTAAIEASREDVPYDSENPLFPYGHGLTYTR